MGMFVVVVYVCDGWCVLVMITTWRQGMDGKYEVGLKDVDIGMYDLLSRVCCGGVVGGRRRAKCFVQKVAALALATAMFIMYMLTYHIHYLDVYLIYE